MNLPISCLALIGSFSQSMGKIDCHFERFVLIDSMLGNKASKVWAVNASRRVVSGRDGGKGARIVVEAHRVIETGGFGCPLPIESHPLGTVIKRICACRPMHADSPSRLPCFHR
jgi:hypothetical protein